MLSAENVRPGWRSAPLTLLAALAVGAVVGAISLTQQLGLVLAAMAVVVAFIATRARLVLDPAWFVVLALFSVSTLDEILGTIGITVQLVLVVAAAPAAFVLGALTMQDRPSVRPWVIAPLALLGIYAFLSLAWSPDAGYGLEKMQLWILTGFLPVVWMLVLVTKSGGISWRIIGIAGVLYAASLLVFGIQTQLYPGRQVLFDENPIWAARALFVAALAIGFGPFPWWVRIAVLPLVVAAGATTDSLGPSLGLGFGVWAGVLVSIHRAGRARAGVLLLGAAVGAVLVAATLAVIAADADNGARVLEEFARDPNVRSRAYYYDVAIRLVAGNPLGGVGAGGYAGLGPGLYPHNMLLEIGAEFGVLGIILFAAWVTLAVRGAVTSPPLAALLAATFVYTLFSGSIGSNAEFWIFSSIAVAIGGLEANRAPRVMAAARREPTGGSDGDSASPSSTRGSTSERPAALPGTAVVSVGARARVP